VEREEEEPTLIFLARQCSHAAATTCLFLLLPSPSEGRREPCGSGRIGLKLREESGLVGCCGCIAAEIGNLPKGGRFPRIYFSDRSGARNAC
jgi:hypothetical protein